MSAQTFRSQLERKTRQRLDAEKRAREYRAKESGKRTDASKARAAARNTKSESTARTKLREAERRDNEATAAAKEASRYEARATQYSREEARLAEQLARAQRSEAVAAERQRQRERTRDAIRETRIENRLSAAETAVEHAISTMQPPSAEKLRVLILGASGEGELRVGREQKRIRSAVESALHRNLVELDVRPAATSADLLDGITKFRPHIVHFSGHSNEHLLVFEADVDEPNAGVGVTARAFAAAVNATDDPPVLVVLNSCRSAGQIDDLVRAVVPFAIGMADEIDDGDAINYAAQFYASLANGQSISAAHRAGRAALELAGLDGADLPTLASADSVDAATTILVKPPE
ncbi:MULTISPECIES: CHAT domain-containing protein [unclassified Agromyces]|uniref:CHAT domain-containing protein n=1 Tax=unclassified Agromyces TaxID=2639701 RepID=UPI0030143B78